MDRRSQRTGTKLTAKLLVELHGQKTEHNINVLDMPAEGMKILTDVNLAVSQLVGIIPAEGRRFMKWSSVVWVGTPGSEEEGEAGLEFLP
jgi:hypothetical protein